MQKHVWASHHENTADLKIEKGGRQGDDFTKIIRQWFITLIKHMIKQIDFGDNGVKSDGEKLNNLNSSITSIADSIAEAR